MLVVLLLNHFITEDLKIEAKKEKKKLNDNRSNFKLDENTFCCWIFLGIIFRF